MTLLVGGSKDAAAICKALGLPKNTVAFSLQMRAGEPAVLDIETFVGVNSVTELVTVFSKYNLSEIETHQDNEMGSHVQVYGEQRHSQEAP